MDSCFPPRGSTWSHTVCSRGRGRLNPWHHQQHVHYVKLTYAVLFTATVKHNNQLVVGCSFSVLQQSSTETTSWYKVLSKLQQRQQKSVQTVAVWCYFVSALCAKSIEEDIPSGCCLIGSLPVTRLMWRPLNALCTYDQSRSQHPHMTKWFECQRGPQTGLSFPRQEAGSSRGAGLSQLPAVLAASLPHRHKRVWWCARVRAGRLIWSQPPWHICCLSCCVVPVCEPSTTGANVLLMLPFMFTNRALTYKLASVVGVVWKVRRPEQTPCASARLLLRAVMSHSLLLGCTTAGLCTKGMQYLLKHLTSWIII